MFRDIIQGYTGVFNVGEMTRFLRIVLDEKGSCTKDKAVLRIMQASETHMSSESTNVNQGNEWTNTNADPLKEERDESNKAERKEWKAQVIPKHSTKLDSEDKVQRQDKPAHKDISIHEMIRVVDYFEIAKLFGSEKKAEYLISFVIAKQKKLENFKRKFEVRIDHNFNY